MIIATKPRIKRVMRPREIAINLHRLTGEERGIEASTVELFNGDYVSATGDNRYEAMDGLAYKLGVELGRLIVHFDESGRV